MHWAPRPVAWGVTDDVYWDLQVPQSPGGAFLGAAHPLRTCERLLRVCDRHRVGSGQGAVGVCGGCPTALPHPGWGFTCPLALLRSRDGKWPGIPTTSPGTLPGTLGSCRCSLPWPLLPRNLSSGPTFHARSC